MVTTVTLRPPFEYYWWVILIAVLVLLGAIALLVVALLRLYKFYRMQKNAGRPVIKTPTRRELAVIKNDYIHRLSALSDAYRNKTIDMRNAYQRLSIEIRGFVAETTGINVDSYTKSEIKAIGIVSLDKLMEEYYIPEFGEDVRSTGRDFLSSLNRTLGVVKSWR